MRQSSKRLLSLALVAALLFGAFFVYFSLIKPSYASIQSSRAKIAGQQKFIKEQKEVVEKVKLALQQYEGKDAVKQAVAIAIPPRLDQAEVVNQINAISASSRVVIQSLQASTPSVQNAKKTPKEGGASFDVRPTGILSFNIKASGTYSDIKSFLGLIESNMRVMDVKNVTIEQGGKPNQDFYILTATVVTYYQNNGDNN